MSGKDPQSIDEIVVELAPRVRAALIAAYGLDAGGEAAAEAMAWALEHPDRVTAMENPGGYLYRVGQTAARRSRQAPAPAELFPELQALELPDFEPGLVPALEELSSQQRQVVIMVHALGWTQVAVAEILEITASTVAAHLRRGMDSLRSTLGEVTSNVR